MNGSTRKPRGGAAVLVKVSLGGGVQEFETEDGLFTEVSKHLSEHFRLAFTTPRYPGKLFNDIGSIAIGDTLAAQQILVRTYIYPPYTDPATKFIFE